MKLTTLLFVLIAIAQVSYAQESHLEFRFSNGRLDQKAKIYSVDIEVNSRAEGAAFYAMNSRFFYEADLLAFQSFSDIREGYGLINPDDSMVLLGDAKSAKRMFGLKGKAGYFSAGIELKTDKDSNWKDGIWAKLGTVNFRLLRDSEPACPAFIWDKKGDFRDESFLTGSTGAVASFVQKDKNSNRKCTSATCNYIDFNYEINSDQAPFGTWISKECIESSDLLESSQMADAYSLNQNVPNPFEEKTTISFTIPKPDLVTFGVYDIKGVLMHKVSKYYEAGQHQLVFSKDLNLPFGTLLYKMETTEYESDYFKMIKIR